MSEKHLETEVKRQINQAGEDAQKSYRETVKAYQDKVQTAKALMNALNNFGKNQAAKSKKDREKKSDETIQDNNK